jgi:hypothetical protein
VYQVGHRKLIDIMMHGQRNIKTRVRYCSFATTASQFKIFDFSGDAFKGFEALQFSMSAMTTELLSIGEFCKLCYDTISVKSASANVSVPIT